MIALNESTEQHSLQNQWLTHLVKVTAEPSQVDEWEEI